MLIRSAAASRGTLSQLIERVLEQTEGEQRGAPADLAVLFVSSHFEEEMHVAAERVRHRTHVRTLLGCNAEGVIGPEHEHEQEPTVVLWIAWLPGVELRPFHLTPEDIEGIESGEWLERSRIDPAALPCFVMLGDPFSVAVNRLLDGLNQSLPGAAVIGGMVSGCNRERQAALVLDDDLHREGAAGVALWGDIVIDTVVSQGCRPVGRHFVVTRAEKNVIQQLGGQPPLQVLQEVYEEASKADQRLMRQGVFLGRVINEQQGEFRRGDFLIRNLMGAEEETGAIAIADRMRVGITVQFHVRDADSAGEDLRSLLGTQAQAKPAGALLFSCNGRGTRMFNARDHDLSVLRQTLQAPPTAGFFAAGELGPVGGKNFIHGHTASIGLFRPRQAGPTRQPEP